MRDLSSIQRDNQAAIYRSKAIGLEKIVEAQSRTIERLADIIDREISEPGSVDWHAVRATLQEPGE